MLDQSERAKADYVIACDVQMVNRSGIRNHRTLILGALRGTIARRNGPDDVAHKKVDMDEIVTVENVLGDVTRMRLFFRDRSDPYDVAFPSAALHELFAAMVDVTSSSAMTW